MYWVFISLTGVFTLLFLKNLLNWVFAMDNYFIHKRRLKELKFDKKQSKEVNELIEQVTKPAQNHLVGAVDKNNEQNLERKLKLSKWNRYFSVKSYIAAKLTLRIVAGIFFIIAFFTDNLVVGLLWGLALTFGLDFLLNNSVDTKKEKLFAYFPDFLRITQGFLSSGMPFLAAIEKTLPYLNEEWQELTKDFIVNFKTTNIEHALDQLKNATDMFEVKEFTALVKLILDQGGDMKDGFEAQAEAISEMQQFLLEKKIAKRKTLAILIQAPLLLTIFATFGLPLVREMSKIGLM